MTIFRTTTTGRTHWIKKVEIGVFAKRSGVWGKISPPSSRKRSLQWAAIEGARAEVCLAGVRSACAILCLSLRSRNLW